MERYDYHAAVKEDVKNYIINEVNVNEYEDREELEETLNEVLWTNDGVTGNGSGSYTFSTWQAEENLCHNGELIQEVNMEFGPLNMANAEAVDVSIRCYLLGGAISEALDELNIH